jgi:hypothetical protein
VRLASVGVTRYFTEINGQCLSRARLCCVAVFRLKSPERTRYSGVLQCSIWLTSRKRLLKKDTTLTLYPYLVSPSAGPDLRLPHREASI